MIYDIRFHKMQQYVYKIWSDGKTCFDCINFFSFFFFTKQCFLQNNKMRVGTALIEFI